MKKIYTILICICLLAGFVACEKDKDFVLTKLMVQNETITPSYGSATIDCSFKADATISEAFVHYSLSSSFAKYDVAKMTEEKGKYASLLMDLQDNTTYYIRYAVSNKYSSVVSEEVIEFQTLQCTVPTIVLDSIVDVWDNRAKAYLHLTFDGGASVTDMGICWSKQANPTIEDIHKSTKDTVTVLDMTDLQENMQYYVRAYAVNKVGVSYSEEKTFTTSNEIVLPTVTTATVTQITETIAVAGGDVTSDGGASVTERGVVYSTSVNPTTADNKVTCGIGTGSFTCNLTDLQLNTKYYVRAYAINSVGIAYGEEVSFMTVEEIVDNPPSNLVAMPFSVSANKQVYFSKGNLQYHPANNEWRFAESQLDYIGDANKNISSTYNGWLDLFGWSTNTTNFGISTSKNSNDYSGSFQDWGQIQIGTDTPNTWSTLTLSEWEYVLNYRANADMLCGIAQVNGVNGLILLPDNWINPDGITFKYSFHSNSGASYYADFQMFTSVQWSKMESLGAVFLPAAGERAGEDVGIMQHSGYYWSSSEKYSYSAFAFRFFSEQWSTFGCERYIGNSVRLVKDSYGKEGGDLPSVYTNSITQITETTAMASGNVTNDGGSNVTERGVVYATTQNPTTADNKVSNGSGMGTFTCNLTDLQPNTKYYVRAYAINEKGTAYGEEVTFITNKQIVLPSVTTATVTQITETTAVAGGNVTSDGGASVTERGVVYSTNPNPVITNLNNTIRPCGSGTGAFTYNMTGLQSGTTYYVRAYAKNDVGTAYGEEVSFTTKEQSSTPSNGTENGYAYVDLGLSVKWATMNVGASKPEDYGDYYAWGEVAPKDYYNWSTYKWCNGSSYTLTKYCTMSSYGNNGFTDKKTQLELSDDAAHVNWGGTWRMPTDAEWTELRKQCTWTWTTQNGVYGYKVTSKKSGYANNSIFLPAAGYRSVSSLGYAGSNGYYWSSSLGAGSPYIAWGGFFYSGNVGMYHDDRYYGLSVRPVCP